MKEMLKEAYSDFRIKRVKFQKMMDYYKGESDAMRNYRMITERSNNKAPVNFVQNFIDEEVSYSVGNDISYISKSGDKDFIADIDYYFSKLDHSHDINLLEKMLINSISYELYYIDRDGDFCSRVISALDGYAVLNEFGYTKAFLHVYQDESGERTLIDVYDDNYIYHYDDEFTEVAPRSEHDFDEVPVGIATYSLGEDCTHKTIYNNIKGLQDSYETNLSDISNEISDFRNAYLAFRGVQVEGEDLASMKEMGVIQLSSGDVDWLIKNINDSFIQNTLNTMEDKMYQLTKHINHNEVMGGNNSSLAIKARMLGLLQKCKLNQGALADCIKQRVKMLCMYLKTIKNKEYDYKDIKIVFSANLPSDDVVIANMINMLGDNISLETALSQLSFVESPEAEIEKIKNERKELLEGSYLLNEGQNI